jgi:hypothetical protein
MSAGAYPHNMAFTKYRRLPLAFRSMLGTYSKSSAAIGIRRRGVCSI